MRNGKSKYRILSFLNDFMDEWTDLKTKNVYNDVVLKNILTDQIVLPKYVISHSGKVWEVHPDKKIFYHLFLISFMLISVTFLAIFR